MSDVYEFFKSMTIYTNSMWKSWLLLTKLGACVTISSRSGSTKARTFLLQGKEIPEASLWINTVCNFQLMKSTVELNRLLLKFLILFQRQSKTIRSSYRRCYVKQAVLKSFAKFTGRQLCLSLFLIKLEGWSLYCY